MAKMQESSPCGVGISKPGIHPRVLTYPAYKTWQLMLNRCYSSNRSCYRETIVCSEWLEYQVFANWYIQQRGADLGWQLDKDLLVDKVNSTVSIYSPDTCILLPERINKCLVVQQNHNGLPTGAVKITRPSGEVFVAKYMDKTGKYVHIGTYKTADEASLAYRIKKQDLLAYLADCYKNLLDKKAISALTSYYIGI